jgi:hypothetical protein
VESLRKFGYLKAPPTLIDLQVELLRHGHLEVLIAICMTIFFYYDSSIMPLEDMRMGKGTLMETRRMYQSHDFKEMIAVELSRFLFKGLI